MEEKTISLSIFIAEATGAWPSYTLARRGGEPSAATEKERLFGWQGERGASVVAQ